MLQAGKQGRFLAEVAREIDQQHLLIGFGQRRHLLGCAVGAAVVDEDDFNLGIAQFQLATHRLVKQVDRLLLVEYRDDERDFH
ncbi:hypothetical protein D3C81_2116840 [compost metagenome]